MSTPEARKGTPDPTLDESEFRKRFLEQFQDPAYEPLGTELQRITDAAWDAYSHHRKSPKTRKAGPGFADPDNDLAVDWIAAKDAIDVARKRHDEAVQDEVRNAAWTLLEAVKAKRAGRLVTAGVSLKEPRQK